jgi:hypothetical protein
MAFAVDLDRVRGLVGGAEPRFADQAVEIFARREAIAEMLAEVPVAPGAPPVPGPHEVMTQVLAGETGDDRAGFAYAYAVETLVSMYGIRLDNSGWYPMPMDWIGRVQEELKRFGVAEAQLPLTTLIWGGSPIPIPRVGDFPGVGHLEAGEVRAAHASMAAVRPDQIGDPDLRAAVERLADWLSAASVWGRGLVAYYY